MSMQSDWMRKRIFKNRESKAGTPPQLPGGDSPQADHSYEVPAPRIEGDSSQVEHSYEAPAARIEDDSSQVEHSYEAPAARIEDDSSQVEHSHEVAVPRIEGGSPQAEHSHEAHTPRLPYYQEPPQETAESENPFSNLLEYWHILRQRKFRIIAAALIGALIGLAYNLYQVPEYQATASLEIQDFQDVLSSISHASPNDVSIQTQVDILKSNKLLNRVRSRMKSDTHPEWHKQQDLLASWRRALGMSPDYGPDAWLKAVEAAQGSLKVVSKRESRVITLQCVSTNPHAAADFINNIGKEFIEQRLKERWEIYQGTSQWLGQAQAELKAKLEASEEALQRFARASGLVFTSETQNVSEEKLKQLQAALSRAQEDRITKHARYEASESSRPEALPEVIDSGPIRTYQVQLADLRRQLAELSSALTPEHYKIKRLQAQIDDLESSVARERGNIIKRLRNDYEAALRTENQLRSEYDRQATMISGQSEDVIRYGILKREVESNRQLYELTLQKGKEASIASALRASDARVVDLASPSQNPVKPILALNLVAGMSCGLLSGWVIVLVGERLNASVRLTGSMPMQLSVRELGVIPSAKIDRLIYSGKRSSLNGSANQAIEPVGKTVFKRLGESRKRLRNSIELVTLNRKPSAMAEAFRATMASILFSANNHNGNSQILVFTSPSSQEGKTTIVSNLGVALAEIQHHVLIVDGDLRIPRLHKIFDVANNRGFGDLLNEETPMEEYALEDLTYETKVPGLYILPSGRVQQNLSGLFHSSRMRELFARLRHEFTTILVDTPPVLRVPDARMLGHAADSVILIFRAGSTTRDDAIAAARCFEEDGTIILGTVMNDWNPGKAGYGSYRSGISYRYEGYTS
jgi:polysaccharide biosynthesis transport protein